MKAKRKRRMSRRRQERTYIAVMVLLAIAVSIGLTRSVMRDDKEFEEFEQQSQEFDARMQRIDEKREASGQNTMLEQVRTWQQEQDIEPDKYAVFDTMSADWGGEEDGFVLYEIPEEYSRTGVDESPRARFRTKDISIFKMYRNKLNFYDLADIEELAGDILMYGLKQNLEVVFEPNGISETQYQESNERGCRRKENHRMAARGA